MRPAGLALALVLTPLGCGGDDGSAGETEAPTTSAASGSGPGTSADEGSETVTADATGNPGAGWQVVAELGVERGMAMSVFGASASEVRVAGGQRSAEGSSGFMLLRTAESWDPEPLPADSPMWDLPNVILAQHTSGSSPYNADRITQIFLENLGRYRRGEGLKNVVDVALGY